MRLPPGIPLGFAVAKPGSARGAATTASPFNSPTSIAKVSPQGMVGGQAIDNHRLCVALCSMGIGAPKDITNCRRFFAEPSHPRQRMYEALRAYFLEGPPFP